jgi:hypothetical protein
MIALLALSLSVAATQAGAQSLDVTDRSNGMRLSGYSMWDDRDGFRGTGAGVAYGIGGRLDVGFDVGVLYDDIESTSSEESRITFRLRGVPARQSDDFPLSLTFGFTYHFGLVESDYFSEVIAGYELQRQSRGYTVRGGAWRDFALFPGLAIRTGAGARFALQRYTTDLASSFDEDNPPAGADRYPTEDISRDFLYEGSIGPVVHLPGAPSVISVLGTLRYDHGGNVSGIAEVGVTFIRAP